jgi:transcriptional regulator with XRE-family HTH domain
MLRNTIKGLTQGQLEYYQVRLGCQGFSFEDVMARLEDRRQPFEPHTLGTRIAHARRLLGLREGKDVTVPDLAARVKVSGASIYNWEGDTAVPSEKNLAKVAKVLGVTPAWLRYAVTEPDDPPTIPVEAFEEMPATPRRSKRA